MANPNIKTRDEAEKELIELIQSERLDETKKGTADYIDAMEDWDWLLNFVVCCMQDSGEVRGGITIKKVLQSIEKRHNVDLLKYFE